jgi:glucose-6-phosphate isomerase
MSSLPYAQTFLNGEGEPALMPAMDAALIEGLADRFGRADVMDTHPVLTVPERDEELAAIEAFATRAAGFKRLIVLGTGGSSLGGATLVQLGKASATQVQFAENLDPATLDEMLSPEHLAESMVLAVSKSGGTVEPLFLLLQAAAGLQKTGRDLKAHVAVLTGSKPSPLRSFAEDHDLEIIPHPDDIGGRYAVLTAVGLIPALLAGHDIGQLRKGAAAVVGRLKETPGYNPALIAAAWQMELIRQRHISQSVFMPYCDQLFAMGTWYRQLLAESLGKGGKGLTPIRSLGAVDQHSQLQLYLDGPKDKCFTLLEVDVHGKGSKAPEQWLSTYGLDYLQNATTGDVLMAQCRATAVTLAGHGLPVRHIALERVDSEAVGALLMHFMLEVIALAELMKVNPYDQLAVEQGKALTRQMLGSKGSAA